MSTIAVNAINPPSNTLTVGSTGQFVPAVGTTAERPTAVQGGFRFNTTTTSFEGYNGTAWSAVGVVAGQLAAEAMRSLLRTIRRLPRATAFLLAKTPVRSARSASMLRLR